MGFGHTVQLDAERQFQLMACPICGCELAANTSLSHFVFRHSKFPSTVGPADMVGRCYCGFETDGRWLLECANNLWDHITKLSSHSMQEHQVLDGMGVRCTLDSR